MTIRLTRRMEYKIKIKDREELFHLKTDEKL